MIENHYRETAQHAGTSKKHTNPNRRSVRSALLVMALLLLCSLLTFAGRDRSFSEDENRYLQTKPRFSLTSVASGRFMQDMEAYLTDQFFARDTLVRARAGIAVLFGRKEINGVYVGRERFLFEVPSVYDAVTVDAAVGAIQTFAARHSDIRTWFALVPNASEILSDWMPRHAPTENQTEQIERICGALDGDIQTVDLCDALKNSDNIQALYYRTDHHWTTFAAYLAFQHLAAAMGLNTAGVDYDTYAVTDSFCGTLASSSGLFNARDSIYITTSSVPMDTIVTYVDENRKSASIFDAAKLNGKNKYEVFFGGNFGQVRIDTSAPSQRVLMVVKDSYANCLVPMLLPYYRTIIMIDPRYYTGDIAHTVKQEAVTDMLWLYNVNTFLTDTSIAEVFASD